jgi:hypothetical protein
MPSSACLDRRAILRRVLLGQAFATPIIVCSARERWVALNRLTQPITRHSFRPIILLGEQDLDLALSDVLGKYTFASTVRGSIGAIAAGVCGTFARRFKRDAILPH